MRSVRKDWIFASVIAAIAALLAVSSLKPGPKGLPRDDTHQPFRQQLSSGAARDDVEKGCPACHGPARKPLSDRHPPKHQCLLCHKPA